MYIFFWGGGGVDHFHLFLGSVYETQPIFESLNFTRMWGGVFCFQSKIAKMGGVSTYFIKYGLIIEYFCNYLLFWGVGSQNFTLRHFSREVDLEGRCALSTCVLGRGGV